MPREDWSAFEVAIIVDDYFSMLQLEIENKPYNKTVHRKRIVPLLKGRSEGSIEFKHQNISAVLINLGSPYIRGYKPRYNYQQALEKQVSDYIGQHLPILENKFEDFATQNIIIPTTEINFETLLVTEPEITEFAEREPTYKPIKINYLEREQNNRNLGERGEQLVLDYERYRLIIAGKESLADKIEWVSKEKGDGAGFDILSKNNNGTDRYVEVKTTKLTKETPIFLSKTEVSFATLKSKEFYLYRVFNFNTNPQLFIKNGQYDKFCRLIPQSFKGYF